MIDFMVIDIKKDDDVPLILGRTFMKKEQMMIDVDNDQMKVIFYNKEVSFNIFESMKHSKDNGIFFKIDATWLRLEVSFRV